MQKKLVLKEEYLSLANLTFDAFLHRLEEHFGKGVLIDDKSVLEDIKLAEEL